jgi:hypothetical protein
MIEKRILPQAPTTNLSEACFRAGTNYEDVATSVSYFQISFQAIGAATHQITRLATDTELDSSLNECRRNPVELGLPRCLGWQRAGLCLASLNRQQITN